MLGLTRNALVFALTYLVWMVPTYVLPHFGSNSLFVNAIGAGLGGGMTPQWWAHSWCLVMLILLAHARGKWNGKGYLAVFPFMAASFDMVPGLNLIPLAPTVMHLLALILGALRQVKPATADGTPLDPPTSHAGMVAALATVVAISGGLYSLTAWTGMGRSVQRPASVPAVRPPATSTAIAEHPANPSQVQPVAVAPPKPATEQTKPAQPAPKVATSQHVRQALPRAVTSDRSSAGSSGKSPEQVESPTRVRYINLND